MSFRVLFPAAHVWRYVVGGLKGMIKEGVFVFADDGIRLKALDPSHVVMVDVFFPRGSAMEFDVEGEVRIPLNMEELARVLRRAGKKDYLKLEKEGDRLKVTLEGRFSRSFHEPVISLEYSEIGEIKVPFKVDVRLASRVFEEAVSDLEPVGDIIGFEADGERLVIFNESETVKAYIELTPEFGVLSSVVEEPQRAVYSYEYVSSFIPVAKVADVVRVQFSNDMPLKLTFELPQGAWLALYVAPRAE